MVPKQFAVEAAVDPEEAFVASISSCHMLTFLDLARRAGYVIDAYRDIAEALRTGDAGLWKQGRETADAAKLDEETWFRNANERVAPYGLILDQYP